MDLGWLSGIIKILIGALFGFLLCIFIMEQDLKSGDVVFGGITYICTPTLTKD